MQLRSIRLRNIRSYESATLALGPGTTLLVGDVGSGKTSLLYAVEMALFGFAVVDPTHLVRHGSVESEVALTLEGDGHRYEFSRRFRRKMRRGKAVFDVAEIAYSLDGAKTAFSTTEIRQRVIELLGFPDNPNPRARSDLWRWAVYVPQEAMREVLSQDPTERLETVRKALGLEQYKTAAENAGVLSAELRHRAEVQQASAGELTLFEEKAPLVRARIAELTSRVDRVRVEVELHRQELAAAESALAALDAVRRGLDQRTGEQRELTDALRAADASGSRLGARVRQLESESEALRRRAEDGPRAQAALVEAAAAVERMEAAVQAAERRRDAASVDTREHATASADLRGAAEAGRVAELELARYRRELADITTALDRATAEGPDHEPPAPTDRRLPQIDADAETARVAYEGSLDAATRAKLVLRETEELLRAGVCPKCHQSVRPEEFESHRRDQAELVSQVDRRLAEERARLAELQGERTARERYERAFQEWTIKERALEELRSRRSKAAEAVVASESRWTEVEQRRARAAEQELRLRPSTERLADAERARGEAAARLQESRAVHRQAQQSVDAAQLADAQLVQLGSSLRSTTAELDLVRADREGAQRRLDESRSASAGLAERLADEPAVRDQVRRVREAQRSADVEHARTLGELERGVAELAEAERSLARRAHLLEESGKLRQMAAWLSGPFREGILRLEGRLLARARSEFERHLSRFFAVLVEDPSLIARCDSTFSPLVDIEGEPTPAEALSGGERTALALAFRLALGLVVRATGHLALDTLVLDEPTDGFSPEQVARMGDLLEAVAIPQVILVSHEAQLGSAADRVVRVRKEGGRSVLSADEPPGDHELGSEGPGSGRRGRPTRARSPRLDVPGPAPVR